MNISWRILCSWLALSGTLAIGTAKAERADCDFDEIGNTLKCGVHQPIEMNLREPPTQELPRWILGHWTGQRADGTSLSLNWIDHGATLEGTLEATDQGGRKELRRFSIGSHVAVQEHFRSYTLELRVTAGPEQYLFSGYQDRSHYDFVRFDHKLKWRRVTRSSYIAVTGFSLLNSQLIITELIGPQHGAMPERRFSFHRAEPAATER
jgi:hypothetical protein